MCQSNKLPLLSGAEIRFEFEFAVLRGLGQSDKGRGSFEFVGLLFNQHVYQKILRLTLNQIYFLSAKIAQF